MEIPVPQPGRGQVLIKVECAPLNPSDLQCLNGTVARTDDSHFQYPFVPGWEGSGTVVQNGGGLPGWRVMGKRVAFSKQGEKPGQFTIGGGYQQYCITDAFQCIPIPDSLSWEQGSMHCVNPMSALAMVENAQEYGTPALIQTAAASQLGQMVNRLCQMRKLPVINIVRR